MDVSLPTDRTPQSPAWQRVWRLLCLLLVISGCARLPRIDTTGERFFVFPNQQPPTVGPLGQAVPGFDTPGTFGTTPGNVVAPPVLAEGQSPGLLGLGVLGRGGAVDRVVRGPTVVGPAVGIPQPGTPLAVAPAPEIGPLRSRLANRDLLSGCDLLNEQISGDRVIITPQRVLAPVGTEVIVRAGVCGEDGYLRTNRRIDWMLAKQGAGEFVQVGEEGELDVGRLPWRTPEKHDNHYAVGFTSPFHTCLRRGNTDPLDDIQVRKGDAWITVSSAREGTSYVTAAAKSVENWDTRRASATIYWVDAQWQFPPSATVSAGQPHTLSTLVTRQTDGTPIAGWIVRYEVQDPNAARLGYDAGEAQEVLTDSQGRASVELTPTDTAAGTTTVNITVIRPEQSGATASPRINVGSGSSTITWAAGGETATPPPVLPPVDSTPLDRPGRPDFQPPVTPPPSPQPAGRAQLGVTLRQVTPEPIKVGDLVAFDVLVQNRGDAPARNILIKDRFDAGLTNQFDTLGKNEIEYPGMSDLAPGDSDSIRLEFTVLEQGRRAHQVTVSADGPPGQLRIEAFDQATFTADPIAPTAPALDVRFVRPTPIRATVGGETVTFKGVVENIGNVPARNMVVRFRSNSSDLRVINRAVERADLGESFRAFNEGPVQVFELTIPRLEPGQKTRELSFECVAERQSPRACVTIEATADGGGDQIAEACVEVLPASPTPPGPVGGGVPPLGPPAVGVAPLQIEVLIPANPTTVGRALQITGVVTNAGTTLQRNVEIRVTIPVQYEPRLDQIQPVDNTPEQDRSIVFAPIGELRPNETTRVLIPADAFQQGVGIVRIDARSAEFPTGTTREQRITVNARQ